MPLTRRNIDSLKTTARDAKAKRPIIATANSIITSESKWYQPGGATTIIHNKWAGKILKRKFNKSGCRRWSGFKLRTDKNDKLNILTAYRPIYSKENMSFYMQKKRTTCRTKLLHRPKKTVLKQFNQPM